MRALFVIDNALIVVSYLMLSFYVAPRFSIIGQPFLVKVSKYAMLAFFFFCALTHYELIVHVLSEPKTSVAWMLSYHMMIVHTLQAIAAPVAAVLTWRFLLVRIGRPGLR